MRNMIPEIIAATVIAAVFSVGLYFAFTFDFEPSKEISVCDKSETKMEWVYWPAKSSGFGITPYGAGFHVGGGWHLVQQTKCLESHTEPNKDYQAWLKRQQ